MPDDGFAKDLPWSETGSSVGAQGARVVVELRDSEQTRSMYPFGFLFRVVYELADGRLAILYTVSAAPENRAPMPFSIGNRVAVRLPFVGGTDPDAMRFQTFCTRQIVPARADGLGGNECDRSFAAPTRLGDFDATGELQLAGYEGLPFARLSDPQGLALRISQHADTALPESVLQFHVSGGPRQGFLCLAPWCGLPNSHVMLLPGSSWRWSVELRPEIALPHVSAQCDPATRD